MTSRTTWRRLTIGMMPVLPAVMVAVLLAGCERDPQAPTALSGPAAGEARSALVGDGAVSLISETDDGHGEARVAQWIGPQGGALSLHGHTLTVPAGAISTSLCFTMKAASGGAIDVELDAWQMADKSQCVADESGWKGTLWSSEFRKPVTLSLTYSRSAVPVVPALLQVVWVQPADLQTELLVPVQSVVDADLQLVRGELHHFSRYALATN